MDASILRMQVGQITTEYLLEVAGQPDVCAVAVRSRVRWGSFEDLPAGLAALGFRTVLQDDHGRATYVADDCRP